LERAVVIYTEVVGAQSQAVGQLTVKLSSVPLAAQCPHFHALFRGFKHVEVGQNAVSVVRQVGA
jgi:hypothetical protein